MTVVAMIEIRNLTKSFGSHVALRDVDLAVAEGEFLTLVGPNGAGKTTLVRILATLSHPTSGEVWVDGWNLADGAAEVRRRIGFISHQPLLYGDLTAEENLGFYSRMYGLSDPTDRIEEVLEQVGLLAAARCCADLFAGHATAAVYCASHPASSGGHVARRAVHRTGSTSNCHAGRGHANGGHRFTHGVDDHP